MISATIKSAAFVAFAAVLGASYLSNAVPVRSAAAALQARSSGIARDFLPVSWSVQGLGQIDLPSQSRSETGPVYGQVELRADSAGQYSAMVEVDGRQLPMLVDTGATFLCLSYADAERLGLAPAPGDFTVDVTTANGIIHAARVTLRQVRLDRLQVRDVSALVLPRGVGGMSLLGMSFLRKLGSFEMASGTLILRP
jgi:aspartyl protease family protein